ncbi:MAG TPA: tetratricopeptide repeat protein [Gemmatimonadales bacterium]|nr:tetratricopeptide repeat protein [Gemmatimonadales bacterium]
MSVRHTRVALLAAVVLPLIAACGDDKQPVTTTIRGSATTRTPTLITDSGAPSGTVTETTAATVPVSYVDAEAAYAARNYTDAAALFESYTRANPENPWGHYMHGLSSWKAGDPEQAVISFDEALRIDPQHRKSLLNSARALLDSGRPREALERIERAMGLEPLSAEGLRLLGRARHELGQIPEAIDAYQRAIALDERDVWAMNNLGLIYIQQDRSEAALPALARAVELRRDSPVFQNNLGTALERTGHYAAAKRSYEAALAADSTYGKASASLARVTPLAGSDTTTVDLSTFVAEFNAEVQRSRGAVDSAQTIDTVGTVE